MAVRRQLTRPGSVSPQEQLDLILADRRAPDGVAGPWTEPGAGWTPFRSVAPDTPLMPYPGVQWWRELDLVRPSAWTGTPQLS